MKIGTGSLTNWNYFRHIMRHLMLWYDPGCIYSSAPTAMQINAVAITTYDTIRDAILTCAQKPTRVSLIYRAEPTTKKRKIKKSKTKKRTCSEVSVLLQLTTHKDGNREERESNGGFALAPVQPVVSFSPRVGEETEADEPHERPQSCNAPTVMQKTSLSTYWQR